MNAEAFVPGGGSSDVSSESMASTSPTRFVASFAVIMTVYALPTNNLEMMDAGSLEQ